MYGRGGYWLHPAAGDRNYRFTGWQLQRQITEELALDESSGFNLGGVYHFSGGCTYAVDAAGAQEPIIYFLGLKWTP